MERPKLMARRLGSKPLPLKSPHWRSSPHYSPLLSLTLIHSWYEGSQSLGATFSALDALIMRTQANLLASRRARAAGLWWMWTISPGSLSYVQAKASILLFNRQLSGLGYLVGQDSIGNLVAVPDSSLAYPSTSGSGWTVPWKKENSNDGQR